MDATKRYNEAVESFVSKLRGDPNIIAVFLAGSLAYDTVWDKSDVDLTIIVRDQQLPVKSYCVDEDDIVLNASMCTRTDFKRMLGKSKGGGFSHSIFSKGKFLYTTDDSLIELFEDSKNMGRDDLELSFMTMACYALGVMEKVEKWITVREDALYAQYYILKAADLIAGMELIRSGEIPSRESVLKVSKTSPGFIHPFYNRPLSGEMNRDEVVDTLELFNRYMADNIEIIARPAIRFFEPGEIRTVTEISKQFEIDSHGVTHVMDLLTEHGFIYKVTQTIRITPKGKKIIEEVAYMRPEEI